MLKITAFEVYAKYTDMESYRAQGSPNFLI